MILGYRTSGRAAQAARPDPAAVLLPKELAVGAAYGLTVPKDASPEAYRLALFILSPAGQAILAEAGFDTPTAPWFRPPILVSDSTRPASSW